MWYYNTLTGWEVKIRTQKTINELSNKTLLTRTHILFDTIWL